MIPKSKANSDHVIDIIMVLTLYHRNFCVLAPIPWGKLRDYMIVYQ